MGCLLDTENMAITAGWSGVRSAARANPVRCQRPWLVHEPSMPLLPRDLHMWQLETRPVGRLLASLALLLGRSPSPSPRRTRVELASHAITMDGQEVLGRRPGGPSLVRLRPEEGVHVVSTPSRPPQGPESSLSNLEALELWRCLAIPVAAASPLGLLRRLPFARSAWPGFDQAPRACP